MGRLIKLSRRLVASGAMLAGASVLAQGMFTSRPVQAQAVPACSSLPGVVYVSGSSAVRPVLQGLAKTLTPAGTDNLRSRQRRGGQAAAASGTGTVGT